MPHRFSNSSILRYQSPEADAAAAMFKKLTIRKRLAITIGTIFSLFVLSLLVTITGDYRNSRLVERLHNEEFRLVVTARTINGCIDGICRALLYAIIAEDEKITSESVVEAEKLAKYVKHALTELRTLPLGDKKPLLDTIEDHFTKLPPARQMTSWHLAMEDYEAAKLIYLTEYFPNATKTRLAAQAMFAKAEEDAQHFVEASAENSRTLLSTILAIAIVMGAFAIVMSKLIIRSISLPINELKNASAEIAQGRLQTKIEYTAPDELGQLAESMRVSAASLSTYIQEIKRVLSELGQGRFDCAIDDIFRGDFVAIHDALVNVAALLNQQKEKNEHSMLALRDAYAAAEHANRAKSDFLSHMSHDIRTPMNAIIGMAAIAATDMDNRRKVEHCLNKIMLSSRHLLGLINDVLDMAKIESGNMSLHVDNLSLPELVENVTAIIQPQVKAKKQNFNIRLHNIQHEWLRGDALRMSQIFINLLSNAVKFTPVHGTVTVDVKELPSRQSGHARFEFRISDTGVGMSPEFIDVIFSAFSRDENTDGKVEGSGLGMAIVKKFVDMMEGSISIESVVGQGSAFIVDLHLQLAETEPEYAELPPLRVLVVDDDATSGKTVAIALRDIGIESEWVDSGQEAVEMVVRAQQSGAGYNAVILDYLMPEMDGLETARHIRQKTDGHIPILIVSAYDWSDFENEARASGVDGFVPKPLFKSTLYRSLVKHLSCSEAGAVDKDENMACDFSGKRILLVEDNEINREVAMELIAGTNATVEFAENGIEALTLFSESKEGHYDLIFMDVQMPMMDGYETTRHIRALHRKDAGAVPIIAMTANAFSEDIQMSFKSGMNSHISKPLDAKLLMRKLNEYIA